MISSGSIDIAIIPEYSPSVVLTKYFTVAYLGQIIPLASLIIVSIIGLVISLVYFKNINHYYKKLIYLKL